MIQKPDLAKLQGGLDGLGEAVRRDDVALYRASWAQAVEHGASEEQLRDSYAWGTKTSSRGTKPSFDWLGVESGSRK